MRLPQQLPCAKEQVVELNVGGHCFTTLRSTLSKHEDSMLCKMFSGDLAPSHQDSQGRYFIDRDGTQFGNVLAYLRGEPLQMPSSFTERSALAAEASFYQLQGLQDMLRLGCMDAADDSDSKLTFEALGRLHIQEGQAVLLQHARLYIGQKKINRICEALTRFYFGERGQGSSAPVSSAWKQHICLFGSLAANARHMSSFSLYKEYVGYGLGRSARYPWSALVDGEGYPGPWRLSNISQSPLLVDIDADELVHLLYTYATLFQTEMALRELQLTLKCPSADVSDGREMRFSISLSVCEQVQ